MESSGTSSREAKGNFEPGIDIRAKLVILAEGPRGTLTKQLHEQFDLGKGKNPQVYALGVKEIWEVPEGRFKPGQGIHTMGFPLDRDTFGGAFIYGMKDNLVDIGHPVIYSVNQRPRSDDAVHPVITGEVNYTFGGGWQAFFGTSLEDAVTLDGATQLGARKDLGSAGIVQGGVLFSGIPTQVWEDPYAEGVKRKETDRDSTGARLQWDRVLGSAFELTFSGRDISIDTERIGEGVTSVTCDASCQQLLRRDGDQYQFDASYLFRLGDSRRHLVRPMVRYTINDREGDAISGDAYRLQLSYVFIGDGARYSLASNVAYVSSSQDARNPIFGRKTDADIESVDIIAARICRDFIALMDSMRSPLGGRYHVHLFTFRANIGFGKTVGALPDGRKAGEPLAYSLSAHQGRDVKGVTALLNTLARLPHDQSAGATASIVEIDPGLVAGPAGVERLAQTIETAVAMKVGQLQWNVTTVERLLQAQADPEYYGNIPVRVAGYSQMFKLVDRELQDHIIARTKHRQG